jgi:hypothetical protein
MRLVDFVHGALAKILQPGDIAIDATAGNGHDASFLAQLVGESGSVHVFDVQRTALATTEVELKRTGLLSRCFLHHLSHERMEEVLPPKTKGQVKAIVFNLGYLPGSDKSIITTKTSTLPALATSLEWLSPGGGLSITAYRGHHGGMEETKGVETYLDNLPSSDFTVSVESSSNLATSPISFLVRKSMGDVEQS